MIKLIFLTSSILLLITVSAFGDFDLNDALPGHITDDQTTTEKPSQVQRTEDISDADLFAILAEDKKKSKPSSKNEQQLLTLVKNKLQSVSFKSLNPSLAARLVSHYKKSASSILQWISMTGRANKISPCFDNVDTNFKAIIQNASNQFTQKKANLNAIEKSYIENLYRILSKLRQCIIAKLKP